MYTTVAKGKKLLKIPKREESFKKKVIVCAPLTLQFLHLVSLKAAFSIHVYIFQFISKQLVQNFSLDYPAGEPGKGKRIPIHLFSTGTHTLSITYCTPYKAKQQHTDVHINRKWGACALTATGNFPGTSRVKGGQVSESAQACCYR